MKVEKCHCGLSQCGLRLSQSFRFTVAQSCAAALCTHHDQGPFALLVGSVGSQDGDHHGDDAHNVEDEQAGDLTRQLQEEEVRYD